MNKVEVDFAIVKQRVCFTVSVVEKYHKNDKMVDSYLKYVSYCHIYQNGSENPDNIQKQATKMCPYFAD